jgi:hypothetical protein
MKPKLPSFIVTSAYYTSSFALFWVCPYYYRVPYETGIISFLYSCKKAI